jgi:ABC-type multidrug transport system permease subunit
MVYFLSKCAIELPLTFLQQLVSLVICYFMMGLNGNFGVILVVFFALGSASCSVAIFLGSIVTDVKDAAELSTLLFVPQLLFAGFFIRTEQIPVFMRWAQYLCSLKYALNLILLEEFNEDNSECQVRIQTVQ